METIFHRRKPLSSLVNLGLSAARTNNHRFRSWSASCCERRLVWKIYLNRQALSKALPTFCTHHSVFTDHLQNGFLYCFDAELGVDVADGQLHLLTWNNGTNYNRSAATLPLKSAIAQHHQTICALKPQSRALTTFQISYRIYRITFYCLKRFTGCVCMVTQLHRH